MAPTADDVVVPPETPMPRGYVFVKKGNQFRTLNCRKQTHSEGLTVYVVRNKKHQDIGIRVPHAIYSRVLEKENDTKAARARVVQKRDEKMEAEFHKAILLEFPLMPSEEVKSVMSHAMQKHNGKVGRTKTLEEAQKAQLGVRAYIRHSLTDYDALLRAGVSKPSARRQIHPKVGEIALKWGAKPSGRPQPKNEPAQIHNSSKQANSKAPPGRSQTKKPANTTLKDKKRVMRRAAAAGRKNQS